MGPRLGSLSVCSSQVTAAEEGLAVASPARPGPMERDWTTYGWLLVSELWFLICDVGLIIAGS